MSRSYKHTPVQKLSSTYYKRRANKRLRKRAIENSCAARAGKSNFYRREYPQYDVCDYRFYCEACEYGDDRRGWEKHYRRK